MEGHHPLQILDGKKASIPYFHINMRRHNYAFCREFGNMLRTRIFRGDAQISTILHRGKRSLGTPNWLKYLFHIKKSQFVWENLKIVTNTGITNLGQFSWSDLKRHMRKTSKTLAASSTCLISSSSTSVWELFVLKSWVPPCLWSFAELWLLLSCQDLLWPPLLSRRLSE